MPIKYIQIVYFFFVLSCDYTKESKPQGIASIKTRTTEYKYALRFIGRYGAGYGVNGRDDYLFVKNVDKIDFGNLSEKNDFIEFVQQYLDTNDSIQVNERLHYIYIYITNITNVSI